MSEVSSIPAEQTPSIPAAPIQPPQETTSTAPEETGGSSASSEGKSGSLGELGEMLIMGMSNKEDSEEDDESSLGLLLSMGMQGSGSTDDIGGMIGSMAQQTNNVLSNNGSGLQFEQNDNGSKLMDTESNSPVMELSQTESVGAMHNIQSFYGGKEGGSSELSKTLGNMGATGGGVGGTGSLINTQA